MTRNQLPITKREIAMLTGLIGWQWLAAYLARTNYTRLPRLRPAPLAGDTLPVSVLIPARNEAARLPALLASLASQRPAPAELIVVDDGSTDNTAALADAAGATILPITALPPGWTGKNYACAMGASTAHQPWLLFLDADTVLEPTAIGTALAHVEASGMDGLSLFLQQRCLGFWERVLLPYAYAGYFTGVRRITPLANGQCILISAEAYGRCGGHAAVRDSVIDDVALAHACRRSGVRLEMARGELLGSVRMYGGLAEIRQGFGKNAVRFVTADPIGGVRTISASIASTQLPWLLWRAWRRGGTARWLAALASYAIGARGLLYWQRLFRAEPVAAPLYPLAALVFQVIALQATMRMILRRRVQWKGRAYR